ncbi:MAG: hypothetical protein EHM56_12020, partial [Chloroflexi bacterium]
MSAKTRIRTLAGLAAVAAAGAAVYARFLQPWHTRWGATDDETRAPLPGDEIAPSPSMASTRAISIQATPETVWRWLVQIGQGRGGLFSYDWLENLVGSDIHTVHEIRPELQHLAPGDEIRMGPEGYPFFRVVSVEPGRALVLQAADPKTGTPAPASWSFVLVPQGGGRTRLIARQRNQFEPTAANFVL